MRKKAGFSLIPLMLVLMLSISAMAYGLQSFDNLTVAINGDVVLADTAVGGTLTLENKASGTVTLKNCNINKLVLTRSADAGAPAIVIDGSSQVGEISLQDSASVRAESGSALGKVVVADKCDARIAGDADNVEVAAGAVVSLSGRIGMLTVGESAQVNLTDNAYVEKATVNGNPGSALSVLKVDTYAAINTLEAGGQLIVNGTGSVNRLLAKTGSAVDMDVTITGQDSGKTVVEAEDKAAVNYMDDTLLPMLFEETGSVKAAESKTVTLVVKDLLGMPLEPEFVTQSSDESVIKAAVSGDKLTLTRVGDGYAIISVTARLTGYLPTHTAFVVNTNKEAATVAPATAGDAPVRLELYTGNICNKTLVVGEVAEIRGVSCNENAMITAASSNPAVAEVSAVSGGAFSVTAKTAGITAVTVKAIKTDGGREYLPAVQKFVVTVSEEKKELIQLSVTAPSKDQLSKEYDGTTALQLAAGTLTGVQSGDDVQVSVLAAYADPSAGTDKQVNISYHIYGKNADKYFAPKDVTTNSGVITRKPVSMRTTAVDRGFVAGLLTVELTNSRASGMLDGDEVRLDSQQAVATMTNDAVGAGKAVTVTGFRLAGKDRANYSLSMPRNVTVNITKGEQASLAVVGESEHTYGRDYFLAALGGSGTGEVTFSVAPGGTGEGTVDNGKCRLMISKAGTIVLQATKAGDESYLPKTSPAFILTVHRAMQDEVSVTSADAITMVDSYQITATGGSGTGAFSYEVLEGGTGQATVNAATGELTPVQAGTVLLQATKAGDDNYEPQSSPAFQLTVSKAEQAAVTVTSAAAMTYGDSYTATATGGSGSGDIIFSIAEGGTGEATIDAATGELSVTKAGTILLQATRAADVRYSEKTSEPFTLTVAKAAQTAVTVTSASSVIISDGYTVTASGGTGTGSLSYQVVAGGTGTATVNASTGVLNLTRAGTVLLRATRAADDNYNAQTSPTFTLTVIKGDQTLTLAPSATTSGAGTQISLNASAPGQGAITYQITGGTSTGSTVNASGVVTLGTVGTVTVTATIAECNSFYTDSESVTLNSTPVAPAITAFSASRANSFDGNYRDLGTFSPTVSNPSGSDYPVTLTYSITKTGVHGSYVHASATANTARLAVGTYEITCTATNSEGSVSRTTTLDIPSSSTSSGQAESGITGHYVVLTFNGNGSLVTYYNWICYTAPGHNGSDDWSIVGYTGLNCTGSAITLASGSANAGASDARSVAEAAGIRSIRFTYHVDDAHGDTCLSSNVNYSVTTLIPYNDVQP